MARTLTIIFVVLVSGLMAAAVPFSRLFAATQPMIVAVSIMAAAILVRLNRGMPTLDWKGTDPDDRANLTTKIVEIAIEYARILAIATVALVGLVTVVVVGAPTVDATWPLWAQRIASGAFGATAALCIARMGYVVWRDVDIVKLQKKLIDDAASKEAAEAQAKLAGENVAVMKGENLRKNPYGASQFSG
jgi:Flp pilus assembly pilin Flp